MTRARSRLPVLAVLLLLPGVAASPPLAAQEERPPAGEERPGRVADDRPAAEGARDREVVDLDFVGNDAYPDAQLRAAIATEATRCRNILFKFPFPICPVTDWGFAHDRAFLDEEELPLDVLRLRVFYRQRGYRNVAVDTSIVRLDGEVRVRFRIDEGAPVPLDSLRLVGLEGILDSARIREGIREEVGLREGQPFNRIELDAAKQLIQDRLRNRGYIHAQVLEETFIPEGEGARVALDVVPGERVRIGEIHVQGADRIGERVVRQFLTFRSGQYFDDEEILRSQRNLYNLEALRFASIEREAEAPPGDTLVDIRVMVTEAALRTIRTGGGVNTTECLVADARFIHRNFLGEARRLQVSGRLGNILAEEVGQNFPCFDVGEEEAFRELTFSLRAEFQQPYFFSSRNSFRGAVFWERESVPDIFVRQTAGAELAVTRRLRARMPVTLAYRPEFTGFDQMSADVFFCVNFGFCQPEDIALLQNRRLLSPVTLFWRYDRTNRPFSPTSGYYATAEIEAADRFTASAWQYVRVALEAADFEEIGEGLVFAARVRAGAVEPIGGLAFEEEEPRAGALVHPRKRFFAGGAQSVRGFQQNLLGPTVLVVDSTQSCPDTPLPVCARALARDDPTELDERPVGGDAALELSLELRKNLDGPWGVVGFVDVGQVYADLSELEAPVATPGFGIRYRSPVGPLRVDIAYNPAGAEELPVVAEVGDGEIRELDTRVLYDPFTYDDPGWFTEFRRRLRLQLSVGEAF